MKKFLEVLFKILYTESLMLPQVNAVGNLPYLWNFLVND